MSRFALPLTSVISMVLIAASSSSAATGTGATLDPTAKDRMARAETLRQNKSAILATETQWKTLQAAYFSKRAAYRISCRTELRQANRDTKLPTLLRCVRGELSQEREFLRKQKDEVAKLTDASVPARNAATAQFDLLLDALNTVITGIDSNVYEQTEDIAGTRTKLQQKYRAPFSNALTAFRADRLLSWVALLLSDLPENAPAAACLRMQETSLRVFATGRGSGTLLPSIQNINGCLSQPLTSGNGSTAT
jgi:hypothetical protein